MSRATLRTSIETRLDRRNPPIITLPLGNRRQIELAIEALLAVLDQRDGDPDLECNGDPEDQSEDEGAQCDDEGVDNDSEVSASVTRPVAPFGTPITATFTNPQGQTGRFVGVGR